MDEVDSGLTWAFIRQQQSEWSSDYSSTASSSVTSVPTFPAPSLFSPAGFTSPDDASSLTSSLTSSLCDSGFSGLSSLSSRSSTMSSASSPFLTNTREYRNPSASITSQDSGFDEIDAVSSVGIRRFLDQDYTSSALGRSYDSGSIHFEDYSGDTIYGKGSYSNHTYEADCPRKEALLVNAAELSLLLKTGLDKYLLIDCRSFLEFNTSHIQQSVNISGTKIVKRRLQRNKIHIRDLLVQTCHIDTDEYLNVIVYDQCTENPSRLSEDNFLNVLLDKLSLTFNRVGLLKGGFLAFQAMYPLLCESKTSSYRCAGLTSLSQPCLPVSNVGPTRILPFLYLGSQQDALSPDIAQVNEITYVLNVSANGLKPSYISDGHFLRVPVNDNYSAKLAPYFEQAFQFLDKVREANGCCLVHCLAGISRSPTLAIAYIMKHLNMSSDDAYRYVKDKRPTISPNFNFLGQLLDFEKQLKREKELNNNDGVDGCQSNKPETWAIPSPSFSPSLVMSSRKGFSMSSDCIQSQGSSQTCVIERRLNKSQGSSQTYENTDTKTKSGITDKVTQLKTGLSLTKSSFTLTCKSLTLKKQEVTKFTQNSSDSKEGVPGRPCVLNLGLDPQSKRVPLNKGHETSMVPSKSLTDIKEASETPSPILNSKSQENIYSTSFRLGNNPQKVTPLLSPFPCGETTIRTKTVLNDFDHVPYSGKDTQQSIFSEHSSVVKREKSKHLTLSKSDTKVTKSSLQESKHAAVDTPSSMHPFSLSNPVVKPGGKRPLRSTLSLALSPVTPDSPVEKAFTLTGTNYSPSACKIERKVSSHSSTRDFPSTVSGIPKHTSSMTSNPLTTSHGVKLKSFNLSASLPLSLMAQSPTTSLSKLHFGSNENSDSDNESMRMDITETCEPHLPSNEQQHNKLSYKKLHDSLEKLSNFPSTSLDKLNFTPCLSSSNENLLSNNTSPRTSGVKRPLNNDVLDLKESDMNCGSPTGGSPSSGNSSVSSPTNNTPQKVVVRKREGRAKRTMVRPNSIAFSTYPTFDLGSDCQDSPHSSSGSSASQDDTSELYTQSGKKSKSSEYMSDVRFRLGRYSEREVYRQITAAMEAAMMKSQSFEASRKSRSLDDILSSEDDNSSPNSPKMTRMSVAPPIL